MPNLPHDEPRLTDGRERLGDSFADPNSLDDAKVGAAYEATNSSAKKHHRPVTQVIGEPFRKPQSRKVLYWVIAAMVVLMAVALVAGLIPRLATKRETDKLAAQHKDAEPVVDVMRVQQEAGNGGLVVPGTTTPLEESAVYARASGYLKKR